MPIIFEKKDNIFIFHAVGDVEYQEGLAVLMNGLETICNSLDKNKLILMDLSLSTENRKPEEIKAIANIIRNKLEFGKLALLAKSDLHYGYSRMFGGLAETEHMEVYVFKDLQAAIDWLNLPPNISN